MRWRPRQGRCALSVGRPRRKPVRRFTVAFAVAGFLATGVNCACAEVDGIAGLDPGDVTVFVADLPAGTDCP